MTEPDERPPPRWRWAYAIVWAAAFAAALAVDWAAAVGAAANGLDRHVRNSAWAYYVKWPGDFPFAIAVLAVLVAARQVRWRAAAMVLAVVAASGLNGLVKWVVGRTRPFKLPAGGGPQPRPFEFHPFWHGLDGLVHQTNLAFPSGHAATSWALAAGLAVVWPRGAWVFVPLALATAAERVLENAHYVSDAVAAVGLSTLLAWAIAQLLWPWAHRPKLQRESYGLSPM